MTTEQQLIAISGKLDNLIDDMEDIKKSVKATEAHQLSVEVFKATTLQRLAEAEQELATLETRKLDKALLLAYLAGSACGGATLVKLIGG